MTPINRGILEIVHSANAHLLADLLAHNPQDKHQELKRSYARLMCELVDYCTTGFLEADCLTTGFIRGLHRMLFPPGYMHSIAGKDGNVVMKMQPGEYKNARQSVPVSNTKLKLFMAPEQVAEAMELAVQVLEQQLKSRTGAADKRNTIMVFCLDFLEIHPFFDANGRMACILAGLLSFREKLPVLDISAAYRGSASNKADLIKLVEEARRTKKLDRLNKFILKAAVHIH